MKGGYPEGASTAITYSTFSSIITAIGQQISVANVVAVIAAAVAVCVGFVFMWWGARKATRMLMAAFRKGRISV